MNHHQVSMSIAAAPDHLGYNTGNNKNNSAATATVVNRDTHNNNLGSATKDKAVPLAG